MSTATKRAERQRTERLILHPKGSAPLVRREIDYLLRNDKAKEAAGFVEPDPDDPYERFLRMSQGRKKP